MTAACVTSPAPLPSFTTFLSLRSTTPPMVMWAQRPNLVFITVCLEDCKDPVINVEPTKLHFKGAGGTDHKIHEVTLEFFGEIDPEVSFESKTRVGFFSFS